MQCSTRCKNITSIIVVLLNVVWLVYTLLTMENKGLGRMLCSLLWLELYIVTLAAFFQVQLESHSYDRTARKVLFAVHAASFFATLLVGLAIALNWGNVKLLQSPSETAAGLIVLVVTLVRGTITLTTTVCKGFALQSESKGGVEMPDTTATHAINGTV